MVLGHLPYPTFFSPGPAYNPVGPSPIISATILGTLDPGVPVYAAPSCADFECDTFAFDRNIKMPYMENYNLNIQQQLGSRGGAGGIRRLAGTSLVEILRPESTERGDHQCGGPGVGVLPGLWQRRPPFGGYGTGNPYASYYVMQENSTGKSNYNSLQASLRINRWRGMTSIVNFVYSKSLDNSSDGEDFEPQAAQPQDSTSPHLEYGPSNFDLPKRFTWVLGYEVPKMGGGMQKLKNGWGISSSLTLQSGQPFQLNYNCQDDFSGGGECYDRPDVVGPIKQNNRDPYHFLDVTSFAIPCTLIPLRVLMELRATASSARGTTGTWAGIPCAGPTTANGTSPSTRRPPITERINLQLRADLFNVVNHPNFANPFLPAHCGRGSQRFSFRATGK